VQTREIPRAEWQSFLRGFSTQHQGWLSTLERHQHGGGCLAVLDERPLMKIQADTKTGHIVLLFGHADSEQVTEVAKEPAKIKFLEAAPGAHAGLEIELSDGTSLVLRFRTAMPPEMIDGIAA
jgi:hypothetical protein